MGCFEDAVEFSGRNEDDIFSAAPLDEDRFAIVYNSIEELGEIGAGVGVGGGNHRTLCILYWVNVQVLAIGVNSWNKKNLQVLGELAGLRGAGMGTAVGGLPTAERIIAITR